MANSKISALTSATTPLAGTETLPVVQSGTTKQVSVANLTAGRSVAVKDITATSSGSTLGTFTRTGIAGFVIGADSGGAVLAPSTVDALQIYNAAQSVRQFLLNTSTGNLTFDTGNLVQGTAAKGINFTANTGAAAGMTSQLLNWYEEGTWTPTYTSFTLGGAQTTLTATYTRIGRCVYIQATFRNATSITCTGGTSYITGYPFTPAFSSTVGFLNENTAASIGVGEVYAANGRLYPPTFTSGANEVIVMSGFYFV